MNPRQTDKGALKTYVARGASEGSLKTYRPNWMPDTGKIIKAAQADGSQQSSVKIESGSKEREGKQVAEKKSRYRTGLQKGVIRCCTQVPKGGSRSTTRKIGSRESA